VQTAFLVASDKTKTTKKHKSESIFQCREKRLVAVDNHSPLVVHVKPGFDQVQRAGHDDSVNLPKTRL
jgi:hypothetical protein